MILESAWNKGSACQISLNLNWDKKTVSYDVWGSIRGERFEKTYKEFSEAVDKYYELRKMLDD